MKQQQFILSLGKTYLFTDGRMTRSRYWLASLGLWTFFCLAFIAIDSMLGSEFLWPLSVVCVYSAICLLVKRLHDRDKSGSWAFLLLIPVLGPLWIATEALFLKGCDSDNRYGENPIEANYDYLTLE